MSDRMGDKGLDEAEVERANLLIKSSSSKDIKAGMSIIEARASRGDPYSIYTLAKWFRTGFGGYRVDAERDDQLTRTAAAALVPDAVYDLGAKRDGRSRAQRQSALGYYIVAAVMGDAEAIKAVIDMLRETDTIERQPDAAGILEDYLKKALSSS